MNQAIATEKVIREGLRQTNKATITELVESNEWDSVWVPLQEDYDNERSLVGRIDEEGKVWFMIEDGGDLVKESYSFDEVLAAYSGE